SKATLPGPCRSRAMAVQTHESMPPLSSTTDLTPFILSPAYAFQSNTPHGRVPDNFVQLQAQAHAQAVRQNPFDELPWRQTFPLSQRVFVYRREYDLIDALGELVGMRELAGEFIIPAAGNHKLHLVLGIQLFEVARIEGVGLTGIRAFYVDDLNDVLGQAAYEALTASFDHDHVSRGEKTFRQRVDFLLEQRFATCKLHERHGGFPCVGAPAQGVDARQDFAHGHFLPAVKGVGRVTPDAPQIASCEADEDARKAGAGSFALDRFEGFRDVHKAPKTGRGTATGWRFRPSFPNAWKARRYSQRKAPWQRSSAGNQGQCPSGEGQKRSLPPRAGRESE